MTETILDKARRRLRGEIVHGLRPTRYYPLIYASWWHARLTRVAAGSDVPQYLTAVPHPGAGIGHQMANWIAGLWFARRFGLHFAHTPFTSEAWEALLDFRADHPPVTKLIHDGGYRRVRLPLFDEDDAGEVERVRRIIASFCNQRVVFMLEQDQFYRDQFGVIEEIQESFHASPARHADRLLYLPEHFNIAVHVRRGDIVTAPGENNANLTMRWLDTGYFEKVLARVVETVHASRPLRIHIFSQGDRSQFTTLEKLGDVQLCLDMDAPRSFLHMVHADLLVTSKSSFSYKPALLSRGIKVCPRRFWHGYPDRPDWILADDDGSLDVTAVTRLQCA